MCTVSQRQRISTVFSVNLHMGTVKNLSLALLITIPELMYLYLEAITVLKYLVNQRL